MTVHTNPNAYQKSASKADKTTIVVPCYNEEKRLQAAAFLRYLRRAPGVQFLFVNDGSSDGTLNLLKRLQWQMPDRIEVLSLSQNSGKAEAVRQGLHYASKSDADLIGYWDADLATPLRAIDDFIHIANRQPEISVIFGSRRRMLGRRVARTLPRRIVSRICALLARQAVRLPIGDTQCGAKMMRNTQALRTAVAKPFTAGWLFDVELFSRLSSSMTQPDQQFFEQPLFEWTEIEGSKVTTGAIVHSGLRMLRLIAEMRFGLKPLQDSNSTTATVLRPGMYRTQG